MHRWSSVDLFIYDHVEAKRWLEKPAPRLENLVLTAAAFPEPLPMNLLAGRASRLQHITLNGVSLKSWRAPIFEGLRTLSLSCLYGLRPTLHQVLKMLRNSPGLESFCLDGLGIKASKALIRKNIRIELPRLRSLSCSDDSQELPQFILS